MHEPLKALLYRREARPGSRRFTAMVSSRAGSADGRILPCKCDAVVRGAARVADISNRRRSRMLAPLSPIVLAAMETRVQAASPDGFTNTMAAK
jgi:hypothetical protein